MASALLDTEAGRTLLTDALHRGKDSTDRYFNSFLHSDPWPLYVRYAGEKAVFVPRDRFYFQDPAGPSACLWIVPGSCHS